MNVNIYERFIHIQNTDTSLQLKLILTSSYFFRIFSINVTFFQIYENLIKLTPKPNESRHLRRNTL